MSEVLSRFGRKGVCLFGLAILSDAACFAGPACTVHSVGGVPRLALDGTPVSAMAVMPCPMDPPGSAVEILRTYFEAGVRFSSDVWTMKDLRYNPKQWWKDEGVYDWALFDALAHGLVDASADGLIFPRIKIDPPAPWIAANPEEMYGNTVNPASRPWRRIYRRMLRDMVAHIEASDYANRVCGYHVAALSCGEWTIDPSDHKRRFRPFVWDRRDPLPPLSASSVRRAEIRALSDAVADATIDSCRYMKELTGGKKIIGAFAGYACQLAHDSSRKVFESGAVDFVAAPPQYWEGRETGHAGRSQIPYQATLRLHGILYYEESDFRTYLSNPRGVVPEMTRARSSEETVEILRRSIGKTLTGGWENWWFLLSGNSAFSDERMMATIRRGAELGRETLSTSPSWAPAEVAVFTAADEFATSRGFWESAYQRMGNELYHAEKLPLCGVPYDSYELGDILNPALPDYKVYLFLNAFTLTERQRAAICERVRRTGKTAVWVYAPGYYRGETGSVENVIDLTGIRLRERTGVSEGPVSRRFEAVGPSVVEKDGARSVYCELPPSPEELRNVLRAAGAHVWLDTSDPFTAGRGFAMLHAAADGEKTIRLPVPCDAEELFGSAAPRRDVRELKEVLRRGETRVYRLSPAREFVKPMESKGERSK